MEIIDVSDSALLQRIQQGDDRSFTLLVERYTQTMMSVARAITRSTVSEDIVQEAWVSIYKALPNFEGRSSLKTWISTITANTAKGYLRKKSRSLPDDTRRFVDADQDDSFLEQRFDEQGMWCHPVSDWGSEGPEALLSNEQLLACIKKTCDRLPDLQLAVFRLKDMHDETMDDICNILEISPSNARVLLHRARHMLFEHIDKFQETGEC